VKRAVGPGKGPLGGRLESLREQGGNKKRGGLLVESRGEEIYVKRKGGRWGGGGHMEKKDLVKKMRHLDEKSKKKR